MEHLDSENNRLLQFLLWKILVKITKQMAFEHSEETVMVTNHDVLIKSKSFQTSLISFFWKELLGCWNKRCLIWISARYVDSFIMYFDQNEET